MRPRSVCRTSRASSPTGFTLVEVLIAIMVIEIGLLALTASSAVVIREIAVVRARAAALEMARNRIEEIAAAPCAPTSGSFTGTNGFHEAWSAQLVPVATREIRDTVAFTFQRVVRSVVLHTRTVCR
jgi:Tfp pilus assembly protein PilV